MAAQVMTPVPMIEPTRLEELLEKRKAQLLTTGEEAEYAGIAELERILTFINAKLIANRDN